MDFDLQRYKEILNRTMKAFIAFCQEHDLPYYASGGTAIGTMRHQGIIPWDDDIDVYMKRADYERFISLRHKLEKTGYSLILPFEGNYYLPFAKFYDNNTTIKEAKELDCIFGVFIDIFVLDEGDPQNPEHRQTAVEYLQYFEIWQRCLKCPSLKDLYRAIKRQDKKTSIFILGTWMRKLLKGYYKRKVLALRDKTRGFRAEHLYVYGIHDFPAHKLYRKEWFDTSKLLPFEDYQISVHNGVHEYLSTQFGDYMTPPSVEDRVSNHGKYYISLDEGLDLAEVQRRIKAQGLEHDFVF